MDRDQEGGRHEVGKWAVHVTTDQLMHFLPQSPGLSVLSTLLWRFCFWIPTNPQCERKCVGLFLFLQLPVSLFLAA